MYLRLASNSQFSASASWWSYWCVPPCPATMSDFQHVSNKVYSSPLILMHEEKMQEKGLATVFGNEAENQSVKTYHVRLLYHSF